MADVRGSSGICNDRCGCPSPCPGGLACRCACKEGMSDYKHKKCSCGEHCGCNPCTCSKTEVAGTGGKVPCRCGDGCTSCTTCAAWSQQEDEDEDEDDLCFCLLFISKL